MHTGDVGGGKGKNGWGRTSKDVMLFSHFRDFNFNIDSNGDTIFTCADTRHPTLSNRRAVLQAAGLALKPTPH